MKNSNKYSETIDNSPLDINSEAETIKTTNINILLNRVKLDKKKDLVKKTILLSLLFSITSIIAFFALV